MTGLKDMHRLCALFLLALAVAAPSMARAQDLAPGQPIVAVVDAYRAAGQPFIYSANLLDESLLIRASPSANTPLEIVREILEPHDLTVVEEAGIYVIVRAQTVEAPPANLLVIVTSGRDDAPVRAARIRFEPAVGGQRELEPGIFDYGAVPAGRYVLTIEADGFAPAVRTLRVAPGEVREVRVRLSPERSEIETIAVSASRYELLRDLAPSQFAIDQRAIETLPDIGDDPLRAIQRLPGGAASGASAKTHLRGGGDGEIGIFLNGLTLFDPYHIRDYLSVFSAVDSRALEGVEVYTGGFPVRYGNRMSGVVLMESLDPLERRHTELGLSVYNTSLLFAGNDPGRHWLFSARRGNLDLVINPDLGSPSYFDLFGEYSFEPNPTTTISLNALYASDRVEIVLETDPAELERVTSRTDNVQVWLQLENEWSDALSSQSVLSATWFDNLRRGSLGDAEKLVASVYDDRKILQFGFRQDFLYRPSEKHLVQWGLQVRQAEADYLYRNSAEYFELQAMFDGYDEPRNRDIEVSPQGSSYALYFSDRWKLGAGTLLEWGIRWDDQTYTTAASDAQLSPRLNVMRSLGERTELRLAWGRYHQAQEINELQVEDGITRFWPAQRADHLILGVKRLIRDHFALRVELFEKDIRDVQPRFENLFDPLGLIPEVQPDRVRLDPSSARARGLEVTLDRNNGPLRWWMSYTLSEATDRIDGRRELRSWDQRHAFVGGLDYKGDRWDFAVAASVHSGWPLTELSLLETGVDDDGEPEYLAVPGARNATRHDLFASLDLRIARKWQFPDSSLTAFLEISNALNRRNPCCLDWDLEEDELSGEVSLERGKDYWMPLLPAIGILWEF